MTLDRREFLLGSIGVGTALQWTHSVSETASPSGDIVFEDQTTDGTTITISEISLDIDAELGVLNIDVNERVKRHRPLESGTYVEFELEIPGLLTESAELAVSLYDERGEGFARDVAMVTVDDSLDVKDEIGPNLIPPDGQSFEYPYFLYAPPSIADDAKPLLVQPNNTGYVDDDLATHRDATEDAITDGWFRETSEALMAATIVPVFPRPASEPVDWTHYTHALDRETLNIDDGPLEAIDRQLLAMIEDARERLLEEDYPIAMEGFMLNGFSASGNFVDRFAALHPDEVISVTAGGLNGMPLLPIDSAAGAPLHYHVGVDDVETLTGEAFDLEGFRTVKRFLYMGEFDESDTILYDDAFTDDNLRQHTLDIFGTHMLEDRFAYAESVFRELEVEAVFRMVERAIHTPRPVQDEIVSFHQRCLEGDPIDELREVFGGNVPDLGLHAEYWPRDPNPGEEVTFSAARSYRSDEAWISFAWMIEGSTLSGEEATWTFEESGGYNITLTGETESGEREQFVEQLHVSAEKDPVSPEVIFEDQTTPGDVVTIERVATDVDAFLSINGEDGSFLIDDPEDRLDLAAGESVDRFTLRFPDPVTRSQELTAALWESNGGLLTEVTATFEVEEYTEFVEGFEPRLIEAEPDAGFYFPYYLYAPYGSVDDSLPILLEPNNSTRSDSLFVHQQDAEERIKEGIIRRLADRLGTPLIVPVLPRPESEPVDRTHSPQQLDKEALGIPDGPLNRIDLQVLSMADHARAVLRDREYAVGEGLILHGFSATANFVNRFAALHPEKVVAVAAGGINGIPILPQETARTQSGATVELPYHIGVSDLASYTGEGFDLVAYRDVPQFLYMGEFDHSDTLPYWTDDSLIERGIDVYGRNMQADRFPFARAVHEDLDCAVVFKEYASVGHEPRSAEYDITAFFRRVLNGEAIESIREDLGGGVPNSRAHIACTPEEPRVGEPVAFDASRSLVRDRTIASYSWDFGDGVTERGAVQSHRFEESGSHIVELMVEDDDGRSHQSSIALTVDVQGIRFEEIELPEEAIQVGEEFTLSVTVANPGHNRLEDTILVQIDDVPHEQISVSLEGGEDQRVETTISTEGFDPGEIVITVGAHGELEGTVEIEEKVDDTTPSEAEEDDDGDDDASIPGFGIPAAVLSLGGIGYLVRRRLDGDER